MRTPDWYLRILSQISKTDQFTSYLKSNKSGDSPQKMVRDFEKQLGQKIPDRFKERLMAQVSMEKASSRK